MLCSNKRGKFSEWIFKMSETILSAIISSVAGLFGVLIGAYITIRNLKKDRSDKYLLAGLESKLKAHQEAYELACLLPSAAHNSENGNTQINKCEEWYRKNCLYLEPDARIAFFKAIQTAANYYLYLHEWRAKNDSTELEKKWAKIIGVKSIIESNVSKPLFLPKDIKKEEYDAKGKVNNDKKKA